MPVTVLSRCQRFDLRRIDAALLVEHFRAIAKKEEVEVEDEALAMIARAAEGSVRDGLSLLDQAIALGGGRVSGANLRDMLGIADRARVIELFDHVMNGRASEALAELKDQYESGADPAVVLSDMADFIHFVTRLKVTGDAAAQDATMSQTEIERGREMAAGLDMRVLARAWQMSLKGLAEIRAADKPLSAADMLLVRMAYAADMPPPEDLVRQLTSQTPSGTGAPARSAPAPQGGPQAQSGAPPASFAPPADQTPDPAPASFEDIVALAGRHRELRLKTALERQVRVVKFEPGRLEIQLADGARKGLPGELTQKLQEWTGARWVVVLSTGSAAPTLEEKRRETEDRQRKEILKRPEVRAVMDTFPGAKVTAVRMREDKDGQDPQTGNTPQTETGA